MRSAWLAMLLVAACVPPATVHTTAIYAVPPERVFQAAMLATQDLHGLSDCDMQRHTCVTRAFRRMDWIGTRTRTSDRVRGAWSFRVITVSAGSYVEVAPVAQKAMVVGGTRTWVNVPPNQADISEPLEGGAYDIAQAIDARLQASRR